jgi:hypothetical protein
VPPPLLSSCTSLVVLSATAVEADGSGEFLAEEGVVLALVRSSSRTYSSSSESLRMMMLPSPGGPRRSHLRSSKSLRMMSSSREVLGAVSSSCEDKSTIGNPSEGSPCSYNGDGGPWDEPSGEETSDGEDGVGDAGGVDASLDKDEDALA